MARRVDHSQLLAREELVSPPILPSQRACDDHSFELPGALYIAMAGLFFGFVIVLSLTFAGHMAVSFGVIVAFIAAFFTVPTIFAHAGPARQRRTRQIGWAEFVDNGVATATGRTSGRDAAILVLLLPALIFCFGVAVAMIGVVS